MIGNLRAPEKRKLERVTTTTAITQITLTKHIMCLIDSCVVLCKCVFGNSVSHKLFASLTLERAALFGSTLFYFFLFLFLSQRFVMRARSFQCVALFSSYVSLSVFAVAMNVRRVFVCIFAVDVFQSVL